MGPIGKIFATMDLPPVTHEEARNAAIDLINGHFKNEPRKGGGVYISIPAKPDNTDLILLRYFEEQMVPDPTQ